jgi:hypothetical protein
MVLPYNLIDKWKPLEKLWRSTNSETWDLLGPNLPGATIERILLLQRNNLIH